MPGGHYGYGTGDQSESETQVHEGHESQGAGGGEQ